MKRYERREAGRRLMSLLPICARLDGKRFSRFTRGLKRPFDERLSDLMVEVTRALVTETGARIGYTQSDEISLVWQADSDGYQIFMDGKIQKMTSILASMCTALFNKKLHASIPEKSGETPLFDARVWSVPNRAEAANSLLWRELDATKNSISMAAREYYSHSELQNKTGNEMQELLFQKGVNWNDYPSFFKRGTFVQRRASRRRFSAPEIEALPAQHEARRDPNLIVERKEVVALSMPPFRSVTNRVEVIFLGVAPTLGPTSTLA